MMMDKIHDERDDDPECIPSRVGPPAAAITGKYEKISLTASEISPAIATECTIYSWGAWSHLWLR